MSVASQRGTEDLLPVADGILLRPTVTSRSHSIQGVRGGLDQHRTMPFGIRLADIVCKVHGIVLGSAHCSSGSTPLPGKSVNQIAH